MTPEVLLAVMLPIWLGLLAGLWRVAVRVEQTDVLMQNLREWSTAAPWGDRRG